MSSWILALLIYGSLPNRAPPALLARRYTTRPHPLPLNPPRLAHLADNYKSNTGAVKWRAHWRAIRSTWVDSLSLSKLSVCCFFRHFGEDLHGSLYYVTVAVDRTSSGIVNGSVSGILGMAFQGIASTQATPFWQAVNNAGDLSSPEFSFYLARNIESTSQSDAPGGTFTLGGTNSSLYSGNIEFLNMPSQQEETFWLLTVSRECTLRAIFIPTSFY
jgi:hypothetical protein